MRILLIPALAIMVLATSCMYRVHRVHHVQAKPLPPGQAKKITGSQSAQPYAPGQRNKVVRKN